MCSRQDVQYRPREAERYFLQTLRDNFFSDIRFHEGVQHNTFRDTCCTLNLMFGDAEWLRCMEHAFSSNFNHWTEAFSIIMDFCEPSNALRIWGITKNLIIADFWKRNAGVLLNEGLVADYVLSEIAERCYHIEMDDQEHPVDTENVDSIALNTKKFNKDQEEVFNTIAGEILQEYRQIIFMHQFKFRLIINLRTLEHTS